MVFAITAGNDDGSGIRMGMSVGADVLHMDQFFATRPFYPPQGLAYGIFVNELGQRFINEDAYHGRVTHYMLRQPNDRCWLLVEGETETWVINELARQCGHHFDAEGVKVIEFA